MQQTPLVAGLSQPFVKLGTLKAMSDVAARLAVAKKAVEDIGGIEQSLLSSGTDKAGMDAAMMDTAELAGVAVTAAGEALRLLERIGRDVEKYLAFAEREQREKDREPESTEPGESSDAAD